MRTTQNPDEDSFFNLLQFFFACIVTWVSHEDIAISLLWYMTKESSLTARPKCQNSLSSFFYDKQVLCEVGPAGWDDRWPAAHDPQPLEWIKSGFVRWTFRNPNRWELFVLAMTLKLWQGLSAATPVLNWEKYTRTHRIGIWKSIRTKFEFVLFLF